MLRLVTAAALLVLFTLTTAPAQQPGGKDEKSPAAKQPSIGTGKARDPIPGEVDINFLNGSTVRMLVQSEKLEVATEYGKLTVPVKDVRAIEFGLHFPDGVEAKIDGAIKGLGHSNYVEREKAAAALIDLAPYSYPAIIEAARAKDAEVSQRAKELAKKLQATHPKKDLKTTTDDKIITRSFTIVGKILTTTIKSKTEYFGDVELNLAKMRTLRAVGGTGLDMEFALDSSKYGNPGSWFDTGYQVDGRTAISVTARGMIDVWPQQGGGYMSSPNGLQATQRGQPFGGMMGGRKIGGNVNLQQHCGMLLGKIGEEGEMFIVGERYEGTPETEGRLFLHIGPSQWNAQCQGSFDIKIQRKD